MQDARKIVAAELRAKHYAGLARVEWPEGAREGIGKANAFSIVKKVELLQPRLTEPLVCDPARAMTFQQIQEVCRHRRDRR